MDLANDTESDRVTAPRALVAAAGVCRDTGEWETADTLVAAARRIVRAEAEAARLRALLSRLGVFA